jgi:hypothetical protein
LHPKVIRSLLEKKKEANQQPEPTRMDDSSAKIMKTMKPWVGCLDDDHGEGIISANREELVRFRELIDETLEKKEADISDLWDDFLLLRLVENAPPASKEKHIFKRFLEMAWIILFMLFVIASLLVGTMRILRWIFG